MAINWMGVLVAVSGVALPVLGDVLTFLGTEWFARRRKKREEGEEYARLHTMVYGLMDDALAAANQIAESEAIMESGKPIMNPWAITNDYWIMVKTRYAELSPSPDEVHEISKFFQYAGEVADIARTMVTVCWNRGPIDHSVSAPSWTIAQRILRDLRDKMTAQALKLKSTYWHPDYKPSVFPANPTPPRSFK